MHKNFEKMLSERNILFTDGKTRSEILDILQKEEYGYLPDVPQEISFETVSSSETFCAGKVTLSKVMIKTKCSFGDFSFPIYTSIPNKKGKHPFFVHINFRPDVPDKYQPTEEICDNGFAILSFCYKDVTSDNDDFSDGLAGVYYNGRERKESECGKIAMWAWAASRVMDYAMTLDCLDHSKGFVAGHSRLGKTALLTGAVDDRFSCAFSNDSGCCGAAISRGKEGETIDKITTVFPYWFCKNLKKYAENEDKMEFDQHFLLRAIAPRLVCVSSAVNDLWADPDSEFLCCVAAGKEYEDLGLKGFVYDGDSIPKCNEKIFEGNIGYVKREGEHYFSREDWLNFIEFINKKF